jgi:hypothetical protein
MGVQLTNNATAIIPLAVGSGATTFAVSSGAGALFPTLGATDYFYATLVSPTNVLEIVKVTARADDTFTVLRGQEGTASVSFPANSRLELRATAANIRAFVADLDLLLL